MCKLLYDEIKNLKKANQKLKDRVAFLEAKLNPTTGNLTKDIKVKQIERVNSMLLKPTVSEVEIHNKLRAAGIVFERQKVFSNPKNASHYYIADYYVPKFKAIIEVDGGYHNNPEQKVKDKNRDKFLKSLGIKTIRIPNKKALTINGTELYRQLQAA